MVLLVKEVKLMRIVKLLAKVMVAARLIPSFGRTDRCPAWGLSSHTLIN